VAEWTAETYSRNETNKGQYTRCTY